MFNIKEKFKFLEDGIDFPFYNDIPKLSTIEWAILVIAVVIFIILASIKGIPKIYHAPPVFRSNDNTCNLYL